MPRQPDYLGTGARALGGRGSRKPKSSASLPARRDVDEQHGSASSLIKGPNEKKVVLRQERGTYERGRQNVPASAACIVTSSFLPVVTSRALHSQISVDSFTRSPRSIAYAIPTV